LFIFAASLFGGETGVRGASITRIDSNPLFVTSVPVFPDAPANLLGIATASTSAHHASQDKKMNNTDAITKTNIAHVNAISGVVFFRKQNFSVIFTLFSRLLVFFIKNTHLFRIFVILV
jgi:hypothetical protein